MERRVNTKAFAACTTAAERAAWIKSHGGLERAIADALLSEMVSLPLAEALVLGLMRQGVTKYLAIFGHGSTVIANVLQAYERADLIRCWQFRNEVEMAHAGTALSWVYGEVPAIVTSIGPGALQAMAGSLAAASNGIGVYHLYGDETTHGEGYNMQQVPKPAQGLFGQITQLMGASYTLHTPEAIRDALRKGSATVFHPWKAAPFYFNLPLNTQPATVAMRLDALPARPHWPALAPATDAELMKAAAIIASSPRVAIKVGGGGRHACDQIRELAEQARAAVVLSPGSTGVLPDGHPQNMHVGGSKGSLSGNWAMAEAETLMVIGSRAVCQADCSGIGWPKVRTVININADPIDVQHYNQTIALCGEAGIIATRLAAALRHLPANESKSGWLQEMSAAKQKWNTLRSSRTSGKPKGDAVWKVPVLTQPQIISAADEFYRSLGALKFFDAGDVQANGFQIVRDEMPGETFTESGASYMGFAVSALISQALAEKGRYGVAFTGDGSFMMNPQILIDGVEHGIHGTILLLDNRRMAAISNLQIDQYGREWRTNDSVAVDYVKLAEAVSGVAAFFGGNSIEELKDALAKAYAYRGLSLVHVPAYFGPDEEGGMGAYGRWNVGNWCQDVQSDWAKTLI